MTHRKPRDRWIWLFLAIVIGVGGVIVADETYPALSGATVESLDYYDFQTATDATSPLIANIDSWTGLPFTPNGGDAILAPNASGVFNG